MTGTHDPGIPSLSHGQHMTVRDGGVARPQMSVEDQTNLILGILISFLEGDGLQELGDYLQHVGFNICALQRPKDLSSAWLGHYRLKQGVYDVDRACADLASYPPIAARVAELRTERGGV